MKPHIVRIVLPVLAAGVLQAQVSAPRIGVIRCADGGVRSVYGLAANFILDGKPFSTADAASFSDRAGLIAWHGTIRLVAPNGAVEGVYQSGEPEPILNVDSTSATAIAWLPRTQAILRWTGSEFRLYPVSPGTLNGRVTSIRAAGTDRAEMLVLNPDNSNSRATVELSSGNLTSVDTVPGVKGPAFAQKAAIVFRDNQKLAVETADGLRHILPVSGDVSIERMSTEWLHLSSAGTNQRWALHLAGSQVQLFVLPNALNQEKAK